MAESICSGAGVLIFPCSGGSDVGELSDKAARKMTACGKGKMYCLAGLGAKVQGILDTARKAEKVIAIDGCGVMCSKKILEGAGFSPEAFDLEKMGFEKGKTKVDETSIGKAVSVISGCKC